MQQRLVQQRGFDRRLAAFEKRGKRGGINRGRFDTRTFILRIRCDDADASEASWIDEAKLASILQVQHRVGVRRGWHIGLRDKQTPRHAQVYGGLRGGTAAASYIQHNRLTHAMDTGDARTGEYLFDHMCGRLERLRFAAECDALDPLTSHTGVHAIGNGLDFR